MIEEIKIDLENIETKLEKAENKIQNLEKLLENQNQQFLTFIQYFQNALSLMEELTNIVGAQPNEEGILT